MTRIMMWNIQDFSISKYNNSKWDKARQRWNYILNTIQLINPDIFVLLEVGAANEAGRIATGKSEQGVLQLLTDLRAHPLNNFPQFQVVPPIVSGQGGKRESIAVFFKSTNLQFTGPWVWDGTRSSPLRRRDVGNVTPMAYGTANPDGSNPSAAWPNALPNTPPAAPQNTLAGKWQFSSTPTASTSRQVNTNQFPGESNRSLYLTTFLDTTNAPNNRNISVFAIHAPPQSDLAKEVVEELEKNVYELRNEPDTNEVQVIVGDFNLNTLDADQRAGFGPLERPYRQDPNRSRRQAKTPFTLHNATPTIAAAIPTVLKGVSAKSRLIGKTYKQAARIAASKHDPNQLVPNYYDYIGTSDIGGGDLLALDNILTRYDTGGAHAGGPAANFHVVNRVYQLPGGYVPSLALMPDGATPATIPLILNHYHVTPPGHANADASSANSYFRNYERFGRIGAGRGASDHMALVIDV